MQPKQSLTYQVVSLKCIGLQAKKIVSIYDPGLRP